MVLKTRTLRVGILILVIGVSLFFATYLRVKTGKMGGGASYPTALGPFLLEPRQTIIALNDASSDNVSIHVVRAKIWEATQNVSLANPVFSVDGMRRLYSVTFQLQKRGVYYFVVTTPDGRLVDEVELKFEQTGLAQDLYMISMIAIIVGAAITVYNVLRLLIKRKSDSTVKGENGVPSIESNRKFKIKQTTHISGRINALLSSRGITSCLLWLIVLYSALFIRPAWSDVTVPYEWIVPGAYARFETYDYACDIFYPNYTKIIFYSYSVGDFSSFLEWTVLDRTGDSVRLNVTFVAEGTGEMFWTESVPDEKVDILDIATVAIAFGKRVYEWGFDPNADVTGPGGEPDQKVNILDISFLGVAFGSSPGHPLWNPEADIAPEEKKSETGHHLHRKTLLLDIDVYSRDTFLDDKPLGKTCFWAEPYAEVDTEVMLYDLLEEIIGTVTRVSDEWASGRGWPGVTTYSVAVFELDPFAWFDYHFDWHTGMAMDLNLLGDTPLNPDGTYMFGEDTKITRFASTALGTELNMGTLDAYLLDLTSTNVQLGPPT